MTNYTPIQQQQIRQLEAWLTEKPDNDYAYSTYAAFSGRLAALGNETYLRQLETWLRELPAEKRDQIFLQRFEEGLDDLQQLEDEELGCVVTEAQDFWCFKNHTTLVFGESVLTRLHAWCEEAEYVPLNNEAVDFIKDWKDSFPIPEAEMLLSVSTPLDAEMEDILDAMAFPNEGKTVTAKVEDQSTAEYCRYHIAGSVLSVNKGLLQLQDAGNGVWSARWSDMPFWPKEMLKKQPLNIQFIDGSRAMVKASLLNAVVTTAQEMGTAAQNLVTAGMQWLMGAAADYNNACLVAADSENSEHELNLKWTSPDNSVELYMLVQGDHAVLNWESSTPLVQIQLGEQVWDLASGQDKLTLSWKENLFNALAKGTPLAVRPQGSDAFIELNVEVPEED